MTPNRRISGGASPETTEPVMPWVVLAASLMITAGASTFLWTTRRELDEQRFANAVQAAGDRITGRLDVYSTILRGTAGLFAADTFVSADEFAAYIGRLDVQTRLPGIQGVGWTRRIARDTTVTVDERYIIRYLLPPDERNLAAMGFDMYAEPIRRMAMRRARDLGEPALSGKVTLVQEIIGRRQAGFLLYVPVYLSNDIPENVAERRRYLRGFVYAPFRSDDLFRGIFGTEREPRVSFSVYDGTTTDSSALLHASPRTPGHRAAYSTTEMLHIAGRNWTVVFSSEPPFEVATEPYAFWIVLLGGIVMSVVATAFAFREARARMVAETANRAKSDFLAVMSHELRTPLNAISGYVDLLVLGIHGPINDPQRNALERIKRAQSHLLGLINNVLNYARIEAGTLELRLEDVPVEELLDGVEVLIAPLASSKDIAYRRERGDAAVRIRADREKAQQVLLNLVSNAVKFTEPGGTVAVNWTADGHRIAIRVRDTGMGIPAERLEHIFDPFVQVDADLTRQAQGTGLGLAISRELARLMGGDVTAESTLDTGSTFTFTLPHSAA